LTRDAVEFSGEVLLLGSLIESLIRGP